MDQWYRVDREIKSRNIRKMIDLRKIGWLIAKWEKMIKMCTYALTKKKRDKYVVAESKERKRRNSGEKEGKRKLKKKCKKT